MCGLSGYIGSQDKGIAFLESARHCLVHRGPDGYGIHIGDKFGFGHNRLALIDKTLGGLQPKESNGHVLSFNGEIYNWSEIKKSLSDMGSRFDTNSDSETLLHALKVWGIKSALNKLRGVFAFSYFDPSNSTLYLVRDQMGSRPLYIFQRDIDSLFFSSEIKSFRKMGLEVDPVGIHEYLAFQNFFTERTLFRNVKSIPNGTWYEVNLQTFESKLYRWSELIRGQQEYDAPNLDKLDFLIKQAVSRNMVADFTIGSYVSSGIDSSLIAHTAKFLGNDVPTFSIGFQQPESNSSFKDELEDAKYFTDSIGLNNFSHVISHTDMENTFDSLMWSIEEPRVGQSYPNYFASELASKHAKGVLSGTGGDELFGGYPWRYFDFNSRSESGFKTKTLGELKLFWQRLMTDVQISRLIGVNGARHKDFVDETFFGFFPNIHDDLVRPDLRLILQFEFNTFLVGLLTVEDKISMHHSIETRVPFLDQDLIAYANSIDPISFFDFGNTPYDGQLIKGKLPLRRLLDYSLLDVSNRRKQGFSGPDLNWFNVESKNWITERLSDRNSKMWDFLSFDFAQKELLSKTIDSNQGRLLIWSLLSLESAIRQFS